MREMLSWHIPFQIPLGNQSDSHPPQNGLCPTYHNDLNVHILFYFCKFLIFKKKVLINFTFFMFSMISSHHSREACPLAQLPFDRPVRVAQLRNARCVTRSGQKWGGRIGYGIPARVYRRTIDSSKLRIGDTLYYSEFGKNLATFSRRGLLFFKSWNASYASATFGFLDFWKNRTSSSASKKGHNFWKITQL